MAPMLKLRSFSPDVNHDVLRSVLDEDGAVIINSLLSKDELDFLHEEVDPLFEQAGFCQGLFFGHQTKRIHSLVAKSAVCRSMILKSQALALAEHSLKPYCDKIQLNLTQGIQIWPGEQEQLIHRDDAMFPGQGQGCEYMVNAMWACTDFTRENGATAVVPGSHKWNRDRLPCVSEITYAEMPAGSLLMYRGSVKHGGGANVSQRPRTGIVMSYCLGWLRQSENQYFAAPPQIARYFSKELQDLLGYCVHRPNLGMFEGGQPNRLLVGRPSVGTKDWLTEAGDDLLWQHHHDELRDRMVG